MTSPVGIYPDFVLLPVGDEQDLPAGCLGKET